MRGYESLSGRCTSETSRQLLGDGVALLLIILTHPLFVMFPVYSHLVPTEIVQEDLADEVLFIDFAHCIPGNMVNDP